MFLISGPFPTYCAVLSLLPYVRASFFATIRACFLSRLLSGVCWDVTVPLAGPRPCSLDVQTRGLQVLCFDMKVYEALRRVALDGGKWKSRSAALLFEAEEKKRRGVEHKRTRERERERERRGTQTNEREREKTEEGNETGEKEKAETTRMERRGRVNNVTARDRAVLAAYFGHVTFSLC